MKLDLSPIKRLFLKSFSSGFPRHVFPLAVAAVWTITLGHFIFQRGRRRHSERFFRAMFPGASASTIRCLTWRQYRAFSALYLDRVRYQSGVPLRSSREGWEAIVQQKERNQGALLLMSHLGNWEAAALCFARERFPLMLYVGAKENENLDEHMRAHLQANGLQLVIADEGRANPTSVLTGYRFLKDGGFVAMAGDRIWSKDQPHLAVPCLGAKVYLPMAPFQLARSARVPIIPIFFPRVGPLRYHGIAAAPILCASAEVKDRDLDIRRAAEAYLAQLLEVVRRYPDQWHHFDAFFIDDCRVP